MKKNITFAFLALFGVISCEEKTLDEPSQIEDNRVEIFNDEDFLLTFDLQDRLNFEVSALEKEGYFRSQIDNSKNVTEIVKEIKATFLKLDRKYPNLSFTLRSAFAENDIAILQGNLASRHRQFSAGLINGPGGSVGYACGSNVPTLCDQNQNVMSNY